MQATIDHAVERLDLVNVALGKPSRQSSLSLWSGPGDATGATAGDRAIRFGFHTDDEAEPWWELDLDEPLPVHSIALFNREDYLECAERAARLHVSISVDGETWVRLLETHALCFGGVESGFPLTLYLGGRLLVRYLRVGLSTKGHLHLAQVEVYVARARLAEQSLGQEHGLAFWGGDNIVRGRIPDQDLRGLRFASLTVRLYGRFGNQVVQVVHASRIARALGIPLVHLDEVNPGALTTAVTIDGVTFDPTPRRLDAGPDFYATCYHPAELGSLVEIGDPRVADAAVSVLPVLLAPRIAAAAPADPRRVVVHLRSGDVFSAGEVNPDLVQPPLSFYQWAIDDARTRFGIDKVQLVYEDAQNPVVERLQAWLASQDLWLSVQSGTFEEDLCALFGAVHMISGTGTFTETVAMASTALRSRYCMERHYLGLLAPVLSAKGVEDLVVEDDPAAPYTRIGSWANTEQQRAMMLDYPIGRLRLRGA